MKSGSEYLLAAGEAIVLLSQRREIGKAVRPELEQIAEQIKSLRERVETIEGLYAFDFGDEVDSKIAAAAALWKQYEAGRLTGGALLELRKASPLLNSLYVKAIDINGAYKFSDEEARFAREIGNRFKDASEMLRALRKAKPSDSKAGEWSALVPMRLSLRPVIGCLEDAGAIAVRRVLVKPKKQERWVPFRTQYLRDAPDESLLLIFEKTDPTLARLLGGEWLNCYVHDIIDDQLRRHDIPYELYTDISYSAPKDLIHTASEFDVIGRIRDKIICVECKSGKLDPARGDIDGLIQRTRALREVLSSMGQSETEFMFFVVYDPALNDEAQLTGLLAKDDIMPIKPGEVRSVMARKLAV